MNKNNYHNQNQNSEEVFNFNVKSNFLMNFEKRTRLAETISKGANCSTFSSEPSCFLNNLKMKDDMIKPSFSRAKRDNESTSRVQKLQMEKQIRNPFQNSEDSEQLETPSLDGFLQEINVSRISGDLPQRNYSTLPIKKKEVIRSMDFENISFERLLIAHCQKFFADRNIDELDDYELVIKKKRIIC